MLLKEALALSIGGDLRHLRQVAAQLSYLGASVRLEGPLRWGPALLLGKGNNSVIVLCEVAGSIYACKIRRGDAQRPSLIHEARLLRMANEVGVGPRLYAFTRDVLVMEYIRGVPMASWWREADVNLKAEAAVALLRQARALDKIGLSHNELARPGEHVLMAGGAPVIIDFESATLGKARNVLQVLNLLRTLGVETPLELARRYSREQSDEAFNDIVHFLLNSWKSFQSLSPR